MGGRMARRERAKSRRWQVGSAGVIALAVIAVAAIAGAVTLGVINSRPATPAAAVDFPAAARAEAGAAQDLLAAANTSATDQLLVEVPDVTGRPLEEACQLLTVAGFTVLLNATPAGDSPTGTVLSQEPAPGAVLGRGAEVTLTHADPDSAQVATTSTAKDPDTQVASARYIVCIDPGHQDKANADPEPVGPGSSKTKAKVTGGATGCTTKQREPDLALSIANRLKTRLEAKGITVVLTRTTGAVDISNAQRAEVANTANADLFVRIHADGNTNGDVRGISTLYPAGNDWVGPITAKSLTAARAVHKATLGTTGAVDRGVVPRADLSGFNWARVPSVLVECGFLSNPVEDKLLATGEYQDKLADGMTRGIMAYLEQ
ncbi:MAG: N-acetylmuramoyl-L-alanine amidase [Coriobacteriia bacterium]